MFDSLVPEEMATFPNFLFQNPLLRAQISCEKQLLSPSKTAILKQNKQVGFFPKCLLERILIATYYHRKATNMGHLGVFLFQ